MFWFLTAPAPRFGAGFIVAVALLPLAFALSNIARALRIRVNHLDVLLWISIACVSINQLYLIRKDLAHTSKWPDIPEIHLKVQRTHQGVEIGMPADGEMCWYSQLPCTPHFNPYLTISEKTLVGATHKVFMVLPATPSSDKSRWQGSENGGVHTSSIPSPSVQRERSGR